MSAEEYIRKILRAKFATVKDFISLCKRMGGKYRYSGNVHECILALNTRNLFEIRAIHSGDRGSIDIEIKTPRGTTRDIFRIPIEEGLAVEIIGSSDSENPALYMKGTHIASSITSRANYMHMQYDISNNKLRINLWDIPRMEKGTTQLMVIIHELSRSGWFTPERVIAEAIARGVYTGKTDIRDFLDDLVEAGFLKKRIKRGLHGGMVVEYTIKK